MQNNYIAIDIETTGMNPLDDKIIEIGAVKVVSGEAIEIFSKLINPETTIPEFITKLTGITNDMVLNQPKIEEVFSALVSFIGEERYILGHNIRFDYSFLKANASKLRMGFDYKLLDSLRPAKKFLKELPSRSLDSLCNYYNLEDDNHHRAYNDARAAHLLYQRLAKEYDREDTSFESFPFTYTVKKESPATTRQLSYLEGLEAKHNIKLDIDKATLTKSEASRSIDKIIFTYGR